MKSLSLEVEDLLTFCGSNTLVRFAGTRSLTRAGTVYIAGGCALPFDPTLGA
jgi:hypothetical protein